METTQKRPTLVIEKHHEDVQSLALREALGRAEEAGFDFAEAIASEYGEAEGGEENADRREDIVRAANDITEHAELSEEFFKDTRRTLLLMGVAAGWVDLERRQKAVRAYDTKLADEAMLLADATSLLAKEATPETSNAADESSSDAEFDKDLCDELFAFEDENNAVNMAAQVQKILEDASPGSFLEKQREALGLTVEGETPFKVIVLPMAQRIELVPSGALEGLADVEAEAVVGPQREKLLHYLEKFAGKMVPFNEVAHVEYREDGTRIVLRSPAAHTLLNYGNGEIPPPEYKYKVANTLNTIRHEYGHTQKRMGTASFGHSVEEYKADVVGGSPSGSYPELLVFFEDTQFVTGVDVKSILEGALKTDDPQTNFAVQAVNTMGLRNHLLVMASTPPSYMEADALVGDYLDIKSLRSAMDQSDLDTIVREMAIRNDKGIHHSVDAWIDLLSGLTAEDRSQLVTNAERRRGSSLGLGYVATKRVTTAQKHYEMLR